MKNCLLKWDNTIWIILKETSFGSYVIKNNDGELMKVTPEEIIIINN